MPGSHPSSSPRATSNALDSITVDNGLHQYRQYSQSYQNPGQQLLHRGLHSTAEEGSEMLLDPYLPELSSLDESPTNTSSRNSVDHSIRGGTSHESPADISFATRLSEFVRSTRRDASSERPVIETYIDNEDYQSLLAAISNIRVTRARSAREEHSHMSSSTIQNHPSQQQRLTLSPSLIQEDDGTGLGNLGIEHDEDNCTSHSNSPTEHIYDIQHIMVHNQRQLETQMLRARQEYARQVESSHPNQTLAATPDTPLSHLSPNYEGAITEEIMRHTSQELYQTIFDPRPTISSSYFSSTTESTIVLSSPPPGRPSNVFPSHGYNTTPPISAPASHSFDRNVNLQQRHSSGPYRPFVTGRDIAIQQQQQHHQVQQGYHHSDSHSAIMSTDLTVGDFSSETNDERGRVLIGEDNEGHWSIYGPPIQRRQRQGSIVEDTITESQATSQPFAPPVAPRPNTSLSQLTADLNRRNHYTPGSLPYPGSSIPIPSRYINPHSFNHLNYAPPTSAPPSTLDFRPQNVAANYSLQSEPHLLDPLYRHYEPADQTGGWHNDRVGSRSRNNAGLKEVVRMACRFCEAIICERGMKAQLLADQSVALLSTDDAPQSVELVGADYKPTNCMCKIHDTACLVCGNAIGYHIAQPCEKCLSSDNNGHVWLFHPEYVCSVPRWNHKSTRPLRWSELPEPDQDFDTLSLHKVHQGGPGGRLTLGGMVHREYDAICR